MVQSHWEWQYQAKSGILGLHQSDRGGFTTLHDQEGGVYLLSPQGQLLLELGFPRPVRGSAISACGSRLYVLDRSGSIHLFDASGKRLWKYFVNENALCLDVRSEGQGVAVGASNGLVVYFSGRGKKLKSLYLSHSADHIKFAHDRADVVIADQYGDVSFLNRQFQYVWKLNMQTSCAGIDVNQDASLILLPAFSEGIYAFNKDRETIGAYEIGSAVFGAALCQKGHRILAVNREGRMHFIRRDGSLEGHFDVDKEVRSMDLNYDGDFAVLQTGGNEIRGLRIRDEKEKATPIVPEMRADPQTVAVKKSTWQVALPGGGAGQLRLTANGAFGSCLSELHQYLIWNQSGKVYVQTTLDPGKQFHQKVSRASNTFLVYHDDLLAYYTPQEGLIQEYTLPLQSVAVHDAGLHFAVSTRNRDLQFFDKTGACVWQKQVDYDVHHMQINPLGNALFVVSSDGTLRAYRQCGKLGWEKKVRPQGKHLIMSAGDLGSAYAPVRAEDGYQFQVQRLEKAHHFVLDRYGITLANDQNHIVRINSKGKIEWDRASQEAVLDMENLREHTRVRLKSGRDLLLSRSGEVVASLDPFAGMRQVITNHEHELIAVECQGERLCGKFCKSQELLWECMSPGSISQFHVDMTGVSLIYLSQGKVHFVDLVSRNQPTSQSVAFLEF